MMTKVIRNICVKKNAVHDFVPRMRFERTTPALGERCSNPLSYRGQQCPTIHL